MRIHDIHDLFEQFRRALIAVAPIAEKAGVNWRQEPPYDDWEAVTDGLFQGLVGSAVENCDVTEKAGNICRYGFDPSKSPDSSFFQITHDGNAKFAFICFGCGDPQFGYVWVSEFDHDGDGVPAERKNLDWERCRAELRLRDGQTVRRIAVIV